jgi:hypothetical protein
MNKYVPGGVRKKIASSPRNIEHWDFDQLELVFCQQTFWDLAH